jgi:hypothetical protein
VALALKGIEGKRLTYHPKSGSWAT